MDTARTKQTVYATAICWDDDAVLLMGESNIGKSDLALRLIDRGAMLVSDDQVILEKKDDTIILSAPEALRGKLELRYLGIYDFDFAEQATLRMAVKLGGTIDRFPMDRQVEKFLGMPIPTIRLNGLEASAPIKVEQALQKVGRSISSP